MRGAAQPVTRHGRWHMTTSVRAVAVAVALSFAPSAMAQVAIDLKAAYALPVGQIWTTSPWNPGVAMADTWTGAVPIGVGLRYRFSPNLSIGPYFQWGPAFVTAPALFNGTSGSSGYDMRVGLELVYGLTPGFATNPWFSFGTGWEWTQYSGKFGGQSGTVTLSGWEYFNFQLGLDLNVARAFAFGPYVGFFAGSYTTMSGTGPGAGGYNGAIDLSSRAFHGWFQFGLKGTLNL